MAGRHTGPGGNPARDALRLRDSFPAAGGIFSTAPMLLRWQGKMLLLLLQRRTGLARRAVPVRSEQVCPCADPLPGDSRTDNTKSSLSLASDTVATVAVVVPPVALAQAAQQSFLPGSTSLERLSTLCRLVI